MTDAPSPGAHCWCGRSDLADFSPDYGRCPDCATLVVRAMRGEEISQVRDDEHDFYGKNYYLHHVQEDYGLPDLASRARTDLAERCPFWLRTFLKYVPGPGARVLELGCGHGGFVAMLRWAGFEATGLELSPWLVERVREWFDVPVLTGRLEDQETLAAGSFDCVALMDVLEHLPDPQGTMARATRLLRPGGFLLVQTPGYPPDLPTEMRMREADHPFLEQLKPVEHLHLFSPLGARRLMAAVGLPEVRFEPAIFARYDMFFVASAEALKERPATEWPALLTGAPAGRAVLALLDLDTQRQELQDRFGVAEEDATARGRQVEELTRLLRESETDREARGQQVEELTAGFHPVEDDRAARGRQIAELTGLLKQSETDRDARVQQITELTSLVHTSEADRVARGRQIEELAGWLKAAETDRADRGRQVEELTAQLLATEADRTARGRQIEELTGWLQAIEADRRGPVRHLPEPTAELTNPPETRTP